MVPNTPVLPPVEVVVTWPAEAVLMTTTSLAFTAAVTTVL